MCQYWLGKTYLVAMLLSLLYKNKITDVSKVNCEIHQLNLDPLFWKVSAGPLILSKALLRYTCSDRSALP